MAEPGQEPGKWTFDRDEGVSRDRATVALVDAKVDGLKTLIESQFANLHESIRPLFPLVLQVALLERADKDQEERIKVLENAKELAREKEEQAQAAQLAAAADERKDRRNYRRMQIPAFVLAGISLTVSILSQLHVFS